MQITYIDPLSRAYERMKKALFQPFSFRKWFVVGFTAFLAGLLNGNPSPNFNLPTGSDRGKVSIPDIERIPERIMDWTNAHPILFMLILAGVVLVIIITVIITWLASRGTFMFLDNVVGDRAQVVAPWRQFKRQGNSLFWWRIGFGLICFIVTLPLIILGVLTFIPLIRDHDTARYLLTFIGIVVGLLLLFIIAAYISLFTESFVAPLMYKYNLKILAAWRAFLPLLSSHVWSFFGYGLLLLVIILGLGLSILIVGCLTCCILFLVLMIPYIGSVVLLPLSYTFRAFSLEFLAQFGPDYSLFPVPPPPAPEPVLPEPTPPPVPAV